MNKKTIFLSVFAVFAALSPLKAMEEDKQGSKRSFEQVNSQKEEKPKKHKKARTETGKQEEYVIFATSDEKQVSVLKSVAQLSQTLCGYFDDAEFDNSQAVPLSSDEAFTKKNLKCIKKLLMCIHNDSKGLEVDAELLGSILKRLRASTQEAEQLSKIMSFLDLNKQLNNVMVNQQRVPENQFCFFSHDRQGMLVKQEILLSYPYFQRLVQANMQESISHKIVTELSSADLQLLIALLEYSYPYQQQMVAFQGKLSDEMQNSLSAAFVKAIREKTEELFKNEENSIMDLIAQADQWDLRPLVKGLMAFVVNNASEQDVSSFIDELPTSYRKELFSQEVVVDQNNAVMLCSSFINRLKAALLTVSQSEKECEKTEDSLKDFAVDQLTFLVDYFKKNPQQVDALAKVLCDQLNYFIDNYEAIINTLENFNKDLIIPFNAFLKVMSAPILKDLWHAKDNEAEFRIIGYLSGNHCVIHQNVYSSKEPSKNYILNYLTGDKRSFDNLSDMDILSVDQNVCAQGNNDKLTILQWDGKQFGSPLDITRSDGSGLVKVSNNCIIMRNRINNTLYVLDDKGKEKGRFNFDGNNNHIESCFLLNNNTLIVSFVDLNGYKLAQMSFDSSEITVLDEQPAGSKFTFMTRLNEEEFVVGYCNGKISIFNNKTGVRTIQEDDSVTVVGMYDQIIKKQISVSAIFASTNGEFFITVRQLDNYSEYILWETKSGEKISTDRFNNKIYLVAVQNGHYIFLPYNSRELFHQFNPLIATTQEIIDYMRSNNFRFLNQ